MTNKVLIILGVLIVLAGGVYFFSQKNTAQAPEVVEEEVIEEEQPSLESETQEKIDINAVCEGAVAYMTFPDGESAEAFVAECKEGKHPEVIERFKAELDLGAGAEI